MDKLKITDLRNKARDLGVTFNKSATKTDLIKAIQVAEGNSPCFATPKVSSCGQDACCWRGDCSASAAC